MIRQILLVVLVLVMASAVVALFLAALKIAASPASAHHETIQRSGRQHFYDPACCSDKDCFAVGRAAIKWLPQGWLITDTGQIIPELDSTGRPNPMIRVSKDNQNHICRPSDNPLSTGSSGTVVCIYIAPSGN